MTQTEEFIFQNVAYRPTVYKTGASARYALLRSLYRQHEKLLSAHMLSSTTYNIVFLEGFFLGSFHFCRVHLGGWLAINFFFGTLVEGNSREKVKKL